MPPGEAAFLTVYNAKAGPAAFDNAALTCANVSCHGGVTAPNWRTGTIDVNTDAGCRQCHKIGTAAGNPENNSPFSGLHATHLSTTVGGAILCTECHNMANGTAGAVNHFKFLNTPQMEGPARDTVAPNGSAANYDRDEPDLRDLQLPHDRPRQLLLERGREPLRSFHGGEPHLGDVIQFRSQLRFLPFRNGVGDEDRADLHDVPPTGSPLTSRNCTSCHGDPPSGATYPNVAGKHAVHGALPGMGVCNPCHNGLDTGTLEHYNRANARSGNGRVEGAPGRCRLPVDVQREVRGGVLHRREPDLLERDLPRRAGDARLADGDGQRDRRPQRVPELSRFRHDPVQQLLLGRAR